jgi:Spy/CpxP family protein refolding chaperone
MMGYGPGYGRGGPGAGAGFSPAAAADGRLAALKTELNITANQESAWQAFATKAKAQVESMQAQRAQAFAANQTAPERLAQRAEFAKQRAAHVEAMSATVKDLYDVLTPEQKAIADQRLAFGAMGPMAGRGFRR